MARAFSRNTTSGLTQEVFVPDQAASGAVVLPEIAAPATPPAATVYLYAKVDGKLYYKDDAGLETALIPGGAAANMVTTDTAQTISAIKTHTADLQTSIDGTTEAAPRSLGGVGTWVSGNAMRIVMGFISEGFQIAFARKLQIYGFHGIDMSGGRGNGNAPAFRPGDGGNDASVTVRSEGGTNQVAFRIENNFTGAVGALLQTVVNGVVRNIINIDGTVTASNLPSVAKVTADQAFTATTVANVTLMSFPAAANTSYNFKFDVWITSAAATTGWLLGLTGPASPVNFVADHSYQSTATAKTYATIQALGNFPLVQAAYAAAPTQIHLTVEGKIVTGTTAGTVQLVMASEVAGSAITVLRGSTREFS